MKERILDILKDKERSIHELQHVLDLNNSEGFTVLLKALNQLEDEGKIVRNDKNEYLLIENSNYIVGVLHINKRGFGFVIIDEESDDIFISSRDLKDAFNMDTVMVELKKHQTGSRQEGRIVKVIERGQTRLVGLLKNAKRELVFDADDQKFTQPIYIDHAHSHGAVAGHKVVVEIKTYKPYLKGNVVEILGHVGDPGVDILSVVSQHEAHVEFPKEVYEQIESIENDIDQEEAKTRTDLRNETIVTIDGDDAKDLDDAISLRRLKNGNYYLGVHIADVSYYVEEGSELDKEALARGTSIYLVDRVIPMLPHKLSNGICSLNPHVDRFAISLRRLKNGNYYLGVHIADVSYYVEEGSELDKEALARGTSIYLVDRVIPMLPHKLSNGICSLNPHVDRFAISCFMEITPQGEVIDHDIVESVINSTERMTYNNVNKILAGDKKLQEEYSHVCDLFFLMKELAEILQKTREDRGAIDFDTNEAKVLVDEKGKPTDVVLRQRGESDRIIESFMLVANETVAKHFKWLDLPFIYRVHENPKVDKLRKFSTISRTLGYTIKGSLEDIHSKELSKIVEASKGTDEHVIISTLLLRCMAKARYDEQCLGHFGLADEYYTHFTSPIRRYPDLMVHRLIRTYLFKKKLDQETLFHFASIMQNVADQASSLERKAIDIEREVDDMKMAEYMEDHIGETFEGIVSSITNFGMFVELPNTIEGLIRMEDLVDDFYYFDDINLQLIGKRTGRRFKMSDKVKIKVSAASKREKTIDFQIVGMKSNKKKKKTVIINKRRDRKPKQKFKRKRR